ncbi:MAG TPA: flagellar motor switch protein FliN [Pyrinomonadaceae bacterium]|jgi:flagellar motor switch protein FliN/FliY|nr:flagellar motor switch protein FliN [Pyrinomonadaceae bacterium]
MENENTKNINRLLDVEMNVTVRFGSTQIPLREVANFGVGSMIELDRNVDEPVDLLVNNAPFAQGEVVVVDGYYGVRISKLSAPCESTETLISHALPVSEPAQEVTQ